MPAPGVPLSVEVPLPLSTKVTPAGRVPVLVKLGIGPPVVVTVKVPSVPTTNEVLLALVIAGAAGARKLAVTVLLELLFSMNEQTAVGFVHDVTV